MGPHFAFSVCVCVRACVYVCAFSVLYLFSSFFVHSSVLSCVFYLFIFSFLYFSYRCIKALYMFPLICNRNDESNVSATHSETEDHLIILCLGDLQQAYNLFKYSKIALIATEAYTIHAHQLCAQPACACRMHRWRHRRVACSTPA